MKGAHATAWRAVVHQLEQQHPAGQSPLWLAGPCLPAGPEPGRRPAAAPTCRARPAARLWPAAGPACGRLQRPPASPASQIWQQARPRLSALRPGTISAGVDTGILMRTQRSLCGRQSEMRCDSCGCQQLLFSTSFARPCMHGCRLPYGICQVWQASKPRLPPNACLYVA